MNNFSKQEKTRVIVFAVISLLSVVLVVWFGWGICDFTAIIPVGSDDKIGRAHV